MSIRKPAVAGLFYPGDRDELQNWLATTQSQANQALPPDLGTVRAVQVPHAGYVYSGQLAVTGLMALRRHEWKALAVLGPCHQVAIDGLALPGDDELATPLGNLPVPADLAAGVSRLGAVTTSRYVHQYEHSIEVQLPIIRWLFGEIPVLPLAVGHADPLVVAQVLEALDDETGVVISSDLSHYLPEPEAHAIDAETLEMVLRSEQIPTRRACGGYPLSGMTAWARQRSLTPRILSYATSADTIGDPARVVGYSAIAWEVNDD